MNDRRSSIAAQSPPIRRVTPPGRRLFALLCCGFTFVAASYAADPPRLRAILDAERPPPGVVFEIVSGDPQTLRWAIPQVTDYTNRLRARFPGLPIAVVTHGKEQFALTREKREQFAGVHASVERLARDQDIPVHVCETYATMHRVEAEAFPDYVAVTAAGPVQIKNYQEVGYVLIKLSRPAAGAGAPP